MCCTSYFINSLLNNKHVETAMVLFTFSVLKISKLKCNDESGYFTKHL